MGVVKGGGEVALMVVEPQPRRVIHLPITHPSYTHLGMRDA